MNTSTIISRVWSFCTTLRDDGVGYGDYLEQLTYLIFLKMADEYSKPPYSRDVGIPAKYNWQALTSKKGAELEVLYVELLRELGKQKGMLGQIFTKAQNKIQDPAKLYRGHMINIHPSLLPAYPGLHTHRQVLENGDKQHGVSVHFVTEQLDGGPVILQAVVPVNNGDTEQQLQDKIRVQEHVIYPQAIQWFLENRGWAITSIAN